MNEIGRRIIVVGTTGVGKSTLAASLSETLNIPHIEMDALFWEENWVQCSDETFAERLQTALEQAGDSWLMDGNYRLSRSIVWPLADTVIWLDYPLSLIYWRLFWRSMKRILSREKLWNKNYESFYSQFLAKDSLFVWAKETYYRRKRNYETIIANNEYPQLQFLRFRSPKETKVFLEALRKNAR